MIWKFAPVAAVLALLGGCAVHPYETAFSACDSQAGACYRYCEQFPDGPDYAACHADCEAEASACFAAAYDDYSYQGSAYAYNYYGYDGYSPWYGRYGYWYPNRGYFLTFNFVDDHRHRSRRHHYRDRRDGDRRGKRRHDDDDNRRGRYDRDRRGYDEDRDRRAYDGDRRGVRGDDGRTQRPARPLQPDVRRGRLRDLDENPAISDDRIPRRGRGAPPPRRQRPLQESAPPPASPPEPAPSAAPASPPPAQSAPPPRRSEPPAKLRPDRDRIRTRRNPDEQDK